MHWYWCMEAIIQEAEDIIMKPGIRHRLTVGSISIAMVVVTGCAQAPAEQLGAAQEAVDLATVAGATEYAKEDFVALEQHFALAKGHIPIDQSTCPQLQKANLRADEFHCLARISNRTSKTGH